MLFKGKDSAGEPGIVGVGVTGGRRGEKCRRHRPPASDQPRQPGSPSKCRRRPLRRTENTTTLRGDTGVWSVQHYSVKKLVQLHSSQFPLIVKVTRACPDRTAAEPVVNQVLQIHDSARQTRVDAVDSLGRNLSLPADLPVDVTPTDGPRAGDYLTLAEAAACLPVNVEVLRTVADAAGTTERVRTGQTLLLRAIGEEVFLRANAINRGWIDQSEVLTIPSCLGTEFAVAEGMRGATRDEWTDYKNMFSRTVRHVDFHLVPGPTQIFILGEPRSVNDVSALPYDSVHRQLQRTPAADGAGEEDDHQLAATTTHISLKDGRSDEKVWLQRDVGASCSRA